MPIAMDDFVVHVSAMDWFHAHVIAEHFAVSDRTVNRQWARLQIERTSDREVTSVHDVRMALLLAFPPPRHTSRRIAEATICKRQEALRVSPTL